MALRLPLCSWALHPKPSPLLPRPPLPSGVCRENGGLGSRSSSSRHQHRLMMLVGRSRGFLLGRRLVIHPCKARESGGGGCGGGGGPSEKQHAWEESRSLRRAQQAALWAAEAAYILWLFLLPYAPGDPVWAIKSDTVKDLVGLSLNFFFILPLLNSVGIHVIEAPVLHPMSEGLFNFVIAWTLLFAPLLFTDCRRDRYRGSLDLLWGFQMFLTNTFLIPYMAIRLGDMDAKRSPPEPSQLGLLMTNGAPIVGLIGGAVCFISILSAFFGRIDGGFGGIADRCEYLVRYLGSERLAYAFIWDIILYAGFQPWLIGDNLQNVKKANAGIVNILRFIPVVGLAAYLLSLDNDTEL